ncbi:MAG: DinB family protein [Planctomycetes bacterium]|nr:DinB family protein [Planctomycetota bacterium]MBI3844074.1 DinB family protein [Planctomycetota bacterium]
MPTMPTEVSMLREHLERYRGVTLQTLEFTPADKLGWRPTADLRSVSDTFLHIAQVEDFYTRGLFAKDWDFTRVAKASRTHTHAELRDHLATTRAFTLEHLAILDSARFDARVEVPQVPVPWRLGDWLWYLVEHEVHHKAQLSALLRQFGVTPPFFAMAFPKGVRPDVRA